MRNATMNRTKCNYSLTVAVLPIALIAALGGCNQFSGDAKSAVPAPEVQAKKEVPLATLVDAHTWSGQTVGGILSIEEGMLALDGKPILDGSDLQKASLWTDSAWIAGVYHLEARDLVLISDSSCPSCGEQTYLILVDNQGASSQPVSLGDAKVSTVTLGDPLIVSTVDHRSRYKARRQTWLYKDGALKPTEEVDDDPVRAAMATEPAKLLTKPATSLLGKPAYLLYSQANAGNALRSIIEAETVGCAEDFMNYAGELASASGEMLEASLSGSRSESYRTGYLGVSASGEAVALALLCDMKDNKYYLLTNTDLSLAPNTKALEWLKDRARNDDIVRHFNGTKFVEYRFPDLSTGTIAVAAPAGTRSSFAGNWLCNAFVPNGTSVRETYRFGDKGAFASEGGGTKITGRYTENGKTASMKASSASNGNTVLPTSMEVEFHVIEAGNGRLKFESVILKSGSKRISDCSRIAEQQPTAQSQAAAPAPVQKANARYLPAGSVICTDARSFQRVNAIEMTGNAYAPLPDSCTHLGNDVQASILKTISDPIVGNLYLVGNSGGSVYVRTRDFR